MAILRKAIKKSQASVEFIIVLSMILLIFLSFFSIFDNRRKEIDIIPDNLKAKEILEKVAFSINDVYLLGDNSTKIIILPDELSNVKDYEIHITPNARIIDIRFNDKAYSYPILTNNVTNVILFNGIVTIKNVNGEISVSQ